MATVNNRLLQPQAQTINGIAAGGLVTHNLQYGYDNVLQNPVDGLQLQLADLVTEFVRGSFVSQDWVHVIELLTGTVGTDVFYERKSGVAEASGYIKHTINNPVIYKSDLNFTHKGYATVTGSYECKAGDENEGIADLYVPTDGQGAPTYVSADRGIEITAAQLGTDDIYHVIGLSLSIAMPLSKASQDGDVGYTAVDALTNGMVVSGSLTIQDSEIESAKVKAVTLATAARASLALTVKQSQGASDKTVTIAGVKFTSGGQAASSNGQDYDSFTLPFIVTNNTTTQLTLAGDNKIITIA